MKRSLYVLLALLVAISVLFVSCNPEKGIQSEYGSLKAGMSLETTRTIEPSLEALKCTRYVLKGTYSDGKTTFSVEALTGEAYVDKLLSGSWSVYAEGYNADGVLIAKSAAETVEIKTAQTTSKDFNLSYLTEGTGTLSVTIRISEADCIVSRIDLGVSTISDSIMRPANAVDGYYEFAYTTELPVCDYEAVFTMLDAEGNKVGFTQKKQVHIYTGLTSSETWTNPGVVEAPVFSVEPGRMQSPYQVELSTATDGAAIYYTTDGSNPTTSSTLYTEAITLSQNTTIKAIAVHPEMYSSSVVSGEFLIPSAVPAFGLEETTANNTRSLELTATSGSQIRYTTDGSEPTAESSLYESPIAVDRNMTVKAIAIETNKAESDVVSKTFEVVVTAPEFSLEDGTYREVKNVSITSATAGVQIRYTLDGTEPTAESALYESPIEVSCDTTIKAIAFREGCTPSAVASADYVIDLTGAGSLVIHDPVHYVLSIQSSVSLSETLEQGSELVLTASFAPANESAIYVWYLDDVEYSLGSVLAFVSDSEGNVLPPGYHEIRVKGTLNGRVYDDSVTISVLLGHEHAWVEQITVPLTALRAGEKVLVCSQCGEVGETEKIYGENRTYDENGRVTVLKDPLMRVILYPSFTFKFDYLPDGDVVIKTQFNPPFETEAILSVNEEGNPIECEFPLDGGTFEFDGTSDMRITKVFSYCQDSLVVYYTFEYNSDGLATKWYDFSVEDNTVISCDSFEYDSMNRIEAHYYTDYGSNTTILRQSYSYSDDLITRTCYLEDGKIECINEYDVNYLETKRISYESGEVSGYLTNTYDSDDNIIGSYWYDSSGSLVRWYEYERDSDGCVIRDVIHDAEGKITEIREYGEGDEIVKTIIYSYDADGLLLSVEEYSKKYNAYNLTIKKTYNSDGTISSVLEYDTNGNLTKSIEYVSGVKGITEYDIQGNAIKYTQYDSADSVLFVYECKPDGWISINGWYVSSGYASTINEYDVNGNQVKSTRYNSDGTISRVSEYDTNGNEIKYTSYNSNGSKRITEYDAQGHVIKYTQYDSADSVLFVYECAPNGSLSIDSWYLSGSAESITEYDSNGNKTKKTSYNYDGTIKSISEYESEGNIIKETANNKDGSKAYHSISEFDSSGINTRISFFKSDDSLWFVFENESDYEVLISSLYSGNQIVGVNFNEYDSDWNPIKSESFYLDGRKNITEYDIYGNAIKRTDYNSDGTINIIFTCDSDGKLVKVTHYNSDGTIYYVIEYDAEGNGIRKYYNQYYSDGRKEITEYDADGNRTKTTSYNSEGNISSVSEYDGNGNLIGTYDGDGNPIID